MRGIPERMWIEALGRQGKAVAGKQWAVDRDGLLRRRLIACGFAPVVRASNLRVGRKLLYNYCTPAIVESVAPKGKRIAVRLRSRDGSVHESASPSSAATVRSASGRWTRACGR